MNTEAISELPAGASNCAPVSPRFPLFARVLLGVFLGGLLGWYFATEPLLFQVTTEDLGQLGLLVIRLLKALAVPLVFFAILDALLRTTVSGRHGWMLAGICLVNVSVAFTIGAGLMNILRPGEGWQAKLGQITGGGGDSLSSSAADRVFETASHATLNPLGNLGGFVPESVLEPFVNNSIIPVVLLAVLAGSAMRRVKARPDLASEKAIEAIHGGVRTIYEILLQMLEWIVQMIPFAVFGIVAQVVGRSGLAVFNSLWIFLAVISAGLLIHGLIYYPLMAWLVGDKSPREFLGKGADAIITGFSTNSSLATVPITLRCLTEKLGVSHESARLSACIGTNLNNDGITLYEAMAALFLVQACGMELSLSQQAVLVLAALMAGIGVAGVPEAGLIVLPLVLGAVGLPEWFVAIAIPLVLPVDWLIARLRSAVNVMGDMLVAILLDRIAGMRRFSR